MSILSKHAGLYTDLYELTMANGYFLNGEKDTSACFDYFFRKSPFGGGYTVFAGLYDLLEIIEELRFDKDDLDYLQSIGFGESFTDYLKNFRFQGAIYAPKEGDVVFPYEPIFRVEGNIIETQILETLILNILNFESLIATKASRLRHIAGDRIIADFGLRRAQGLGGILASKAAVIGGVNSTSNVYSAFRYDLEATGTIAHSWVQSFDSEIEAFRKYANISPERCVLLVDTYDTLKSGIPNAIIVAKELEKKGKKLFAVRLDSGDLAYLSKKTRKMLDAAGLQYVKIVASNQLDEYIIKSLLDQNAPIDIFGVGTKLITGYKDAALDGVYKLSMSKDIPRLKISESVEKITLPGVKNVHRFIDDKGMFYADGISLADEKDFKTIYHIFDADKNSKIDCHKKELLLKKVMDNGKILIEKDHPKAIAEYSKKRLNQLPDEFKRFENPHIYKVGISESLMALRSEIIEKIRSKI